MGTNIRIVSGRQFRTDADYQAALKDAAYIEKIKKAYQLNKEEEIERLIRDLKAKKYRFRTILGDDFLDEMEGKLESSRNKETKPSVKKKQQSSKTKQKKQVRLEDYDKAMQASILKELKRRERIRKTLITACVLVAAGCFIYLGIYQYEIMRLDQYASIQQELKGEESAGNVTPETVVIHYDNQEIVVPEILDEYKTLYNLNKRLIGWIKIDDTYIDYPVLQTSNNEYYLDHNFDQKQDKNGSIFLDAECSILPRSTNLIIYGHHMRSGRMFGQLNKYSSEAFYKEHMFIQFDTIYEKGTYMVMYVFRDKVYDESEIVFKYYQFIDAATETEFNSYMKEMAAMSLYDTGVTAEFGDELLTLSTCDYHTTNGRFVVVAKRVG